MPPRAAVPVMSLTPVTPETFADLDFDPSAEIGPLVERAALEAEPQTLQVATALLSDRALRLLREGSRQELLDEALAVSRGISGKAAQVLKEKSPETYGAWMALDELLAEAARRSDRAAVPSLLRGTRGMAVLEMLAREGQAVPRSRIRQSLDFGEAHLSHLLRDLEEADLILRYRPEKSKEVFVELGRAGREVVSQSVLPPWLERLMDVLSQIAEGSSVETETLARELEEAGAPSRLAATKLSQALARFAPPAPLKSNVHQLIPRLAEQTENKEHRFQQVIDYQGDEPPRALFAVG